MKAGLLSDIHGNLEALQEVLAAMGRAGVSRIWCLGDVVGYGANPNECVETIRERAEVTVLGNHDIACAGGVDVSHFNPYAREAVEWTARQLTADHRDWLRALPLTAERGGVLLVHASPHEPAAWHYLVAVGDVIRGFRASAARLGFVGHSHQPAILVHRGEEFLQFNGTHLVMEEGARYLVNVGSAGQPRDRNPKAAFAVYDDEAGTVTIERVPYDVAKAQRKIREAGLPEILASRLDTGT